MNLFRSLPLGSRHFYAYAVGGLLREVGAGSRVFEEFPLDFGRKVPHRMMTAAPRHSRIFLSSPGVGSTFKSAGDSAIHLEPTSFDTLAPVLLRADMEAPPSPSHCAIAAGVVAHISLMVFS
jgi:hypothetical protein